MSSDTITTSFWGGFFDDVTWLNKSNWIEYFGPSQRDGTEKSVMEYSSDESVPPGSGLPYLPISSWNRGLKPYSFFNSYYNNDQIGFSEGVALVNSTVGRFWNYVTDASDTRFSGRALFYVKINASTKKAELCFDDLSGNNETDEEILAKLVADPQAYLPSGEDCIPICYHTSDMQTIDLRRFSKKDRDVYNVNLAAPWSEYPEIEINQDPLKMNGSAWGYSTPTAAFLRPYDGDTYNIKFESTSEVTRFDILPVPICGADPTIVTITNDTPNDITVALGPAYSALTPDWKWSSSWTSLTPTTISQTLAGHGASMTFILNPAGFDGTTYSYAISSPTTSEGSGSIDPENYYTKSQTNALVNTKADTSALTALAADVTDRALQSAICEEWTAGTSYQAGDLISYQGKAYRVTTDCSGQSFPTASVEEITVADLLDEKVDTADIGSMAEIDDAPSNDSTYGRKNGNWVAAMSVADANAALKTKADSASIADLYDATFDYVQGDVVMLDGQLYQDVEEWTDLWVKELKGNVSISVDSYCYFKNGSTYYFYRTLRAFRTGSTVTTNNISSWIATNYLEEITAIPYVIAGTYQANDIVYVINGNVPTLYQLSSVYGKFRPITVEEYVEAEFVQGKSNSGSIADVYDPEQTYADGDLVMYQGQLYRDTESNLELLSPVYNLPAIGSAQAGIWAKVTVGENVQLLRFFRDASWQANSATAAYGIVCPEFASNFPLTEYDPFRIYSYANHFTVKIGDDYYLVKSIYGKFAPVSVEELLNEVGDDISSKAPLASPALTGNPTAPTPTAGDDSTKIATTEFVNGAIDALAPKDSPAFTGTPTAPTATTGTNTTQIATTAFVQDALDNYVPDPDLSALAPKDSPVFTGTPTAPTATTGTNTTQIATTAFVQDALDNYVPDPDLSALAPKDSPVFTGTPTAPTAYITDSSTKLATTEFVKQSIQSVTNIQTEIYVDYNTGNDTTGYGSQSSPFKTIQKAIDSCLSDRCFTIYINPDHTYNESLLVDNKNIVMTSSEDSTTPVSISTSEDVALTIRNSSTVVLGRVFNISSHKKSICILSGSSLSCNNIYLYQYPIQTDNNFSTFGIVIDNGKFTGNEIHISRSGLYAQNYNSVSGTYAIDAQAGSYVVTGKIILDGYQNGRPILCSRSIVFHREIIGSFISEITRHGDDIVLARYNSSYYVSALNGSDNNEGTQSEPFRSIEKALALIPDNTPCTIYISSGSYTMNSVVIDSKYVTIRSWGSGTISFIHNDSTNGTTALKLTNGSRVILIGTISIRSLYQKVIEIEGESSLIFSGELSCTLYNSYTNVMYDCISVTNFSKFYGQDQLIINYDNDEHLQSQSARALYVGSGGYVQLNDVEVNGYTRTPFVCYGGVLLYSSIVGSSASTLVSVSEGGFAMDTDSTDAYQIWVDNSTGNDTNGTGEQSAPFKTIQKAVNYTSRNSVTLIEIVPGIYNESVNIAGKNIILRGANNSNQEIRIVGQSISPAITVTDGGRLTMHGNLSLRTSGGDTALLVKNNSSATYEKIYTNNGWVNSLEIYPMNSTSDYGIYVQNSSRFSADGNVSVTTPNTASTPYALCVKNGSDAFIDALTVSMPSTGAAGGTAVSATSSTVFVGSVSGTYRSMVSQTNALVKINGVLQ